MRSGVPRGSDIGSPVLRSVEVRFASVMLLWLIICCGGTSQSGNDGGAGGGSGGGGSGTGGGGGAGFDCLGMAQSLCNKAATCVRPDGGVQVIYPPSTDV